MNDNWGFSDEDLDGLFRQAAEGQRPRFEPEDWRHMAARLDEAGRDGVLPPIAVPWYRRWGWLVLAGVLLLTGLAVWMVAVQKQVGSIQEPVMPVPQAESATEGASSARHSEGSIRAYRSTRIRSAERTGRGLVGSGFGRTGGCVGGLRASCFRKSGTPARGRRRGCRTQNGPRWWGNAGGGDSFGEIGKKIRRGRTPPVAGFGRAGEGYPN